MIPDEGATPLGAARRSSVERRNDETEAWLAAGDTLAEKAIAALDTGDVERADRLVRRIVALPVVDEETRSGLMAVSVILYEEVLDPPFEQGDVRGLLEVPLRILPTLDDAVADELRRTLACMTDHDLPAAVVRRISAVVPLRRRFDAPFGRVPEAQLPNAVVGVLRLVLLLRGAIG